MTGMIVELSIKPTDAGDIDHEIKRVQILVTIDIPNYDERRRPRRDAPAAVQ